MVECAGLEIRCTVMPYRGFESHLLRQEPVHRGPSKSPTAPPDHSSWDELHPEPGVLVQPWENVPSLLVWPVGLVKSPYRIDKWIAIPARRKELEPFYEYCSRLHALRRI